MPFVAAITVHIHFADSGNLKAKRKELSAVRAALSNRFKAAVAEVDQQDLWQRSTLAVALVGRSTADLDHAIDGMQRYLDAHFPDAIRLERRVVSYSDLD